MSRIGARCPIARRDPLTCQVKGPSSPNRLETPGLGSSWASRARSLAYFRASTGPRSARVPVSATCVRAWSGACRPGRNTRRRGRARAGPGGIRAGVVGTGPGRAAGGHDRAGTLPAPGGMRVDRAGAASAVSGIRGDRAGAMSAPGGDHADRVGSSFAAGGFAWTAPARCVARTGGAATASGGCLRLAAGSGPRSDALCTCSRCPGPRPHGFGAFAGVCRLFSQTGVARFRNWAAPGGCQPLLRRLPEGASHFSGGPG